MSRAADEWRKVVHVFEAKLEPYALQGVEQTDVVWANISYDVAKGQGAFLVRLAPGASSIAHEHTGFEEFYMIEGELTDSDGVTYRSGDFVSLRPGSRHVSRSETGALILVMLREGRGNRTLEPDEALNVV